MVNRRKKPVGRRASANKVSGGNKPFSLVVAMLSFAIFAHVAGCAEQGGGDKAAAQAAPSKPDGLAVFRQNCVNCHGTDGKLGLNGAKDLSKSTLSLDERVLVITNGRNQMTAWKGLLSPDEIRAVAEHTLTLK